MNGKTFVRVFRFAQSYGHGWANALTSNAACGDAVVGAFARAARMAIDTSDAAERAAAEAEMASLSESLDQQKALVEAADRLLAEEEGEIPGIRAGSCFMERNSDLHYDHITGSRRLEVWVRGSGVDFSISRPEERDLLCVSVNLTSGSFRIYSGDSDSFLAEDHDACVRRWERHLRLRHIWALEDAVRAFFSLVADHELRADVLAAIRAEAACVFREQEESVELSRWYISGAERCAAQLSELQSSLSRETRSALLQELKRIHACEQDCPVLLPFDYSPSSPDTVFLRDFFELPTNGVRYEDRRGVLAVFGATYQDLPARNGERCDAEFFFAAGVRPSDVERCASQHTDETPRAALWEALTDAVAEREGKGTFALRRDVSFCVNYPDQSLAALGSE